MTKLYNLGDIGNAIHPACVIPGKFIDSLGIEPTKKDKAGRFYDAEKAEQILKGIAARATELADQLDSGFDLDKKPKRVKPAEAPATPPAVDDDDEL